MIRQDLETVIKKSEKGLREILTEIKTWEKSINDGITEIQILISKGFKK